jgi:hypothetical protein
VELRSKLELLVTTNVVRSSLMLLTVMMEAIRYSKTRATQRNIQEDGTLHSYRRENLKSYIALNG